MAEWLLDVRACIYPEISSNTCHVTVFTVIMTAAEDNFKPQTDVQLYDKKCKCVISSQ